MAGASAQEYPDPAKQIRMVVAFVPGGGTDLVGRLAAKAIGDVTGANVILILFALVNTSNNAQIQS